jgi:hypothetical protein
MELATLYVVYIRLEAARYRLLPAKNHRFSAVKGLCTALGALGAVKLQSSTAITAQGSSDGNLI